MKQWNRVRTILVALGLIVGTSLPVFAQASAPSNGPMCCRGRMGPGGVGQCGGMQGGMRERGMQGGRRGNMADMGQIHTLLANHDAIQRTVRQLPNGVETVTTSEDPRIAALLPEHVQAMYTRMKEGRLIRGFDPLFVELFRQAGKIKVEVEQRKDGVRVVETSRDPYAVKLIQAHAAAVDGFVQDGMAAMHQTHPVPSR